MESQVWVIQLDSLSHSNSLELNTTEHILRKPSSEVGEASLSVGTGEIIDPPFWLIFLTAVFSDVATCM